MQKTWVCLACSLFALALLCLPAYAKWDDLPESLRAVVTLTDPFGNPSVAVAIVYFDYAPMRTLWDDPTQSESKAFFIKVYFDMVPPLYRQFGTLTHILYVMVAPGPGLQARTQWWPWNVVFAQDEVSYQITEAETYVGTRGSFSGRVYGYMDGYIRIPDEIDLSRPFQVWYESSTATIGPICPQS